MQSSTDSNADTDLEMVHRLRAQHFDAAIIFTCRGQSPLPAAMLCHLAGVPLRAGHCDENPYHLLTDWIVDPERLESVKHEVRRQLDLVAALGCSSYDERLSFSIPPDDKIWTHQYLKKIGIDLAQPWLLIHPSSAASSLRYPPKLWADVINRLSAKLDCPIMFSGGDDEVTLIEQIRNELNCASYSLAGKLALGRFVAVLACAPIFLCNNSDPAHLAAVVGTPVIDIYALAHCQHAPRSLPQRVLYHDSSEKIEPAYVVQKTIELLQQTYRDRFGNRRQWLSSSPTSDTLLQPLFPQRASKNHKNTQLEPLTPIVIHPNHPAVAAIKEWRKGGLHH